jgi:hypothetical protein
MKYDILTLVVWVGVVVFILSVVSAGLLRRFASELTLKEGFFIAFVAYGVSTFALIAYTFAKPFLGIPSYYADFIGTIAWMGLTGTIMTVQGRKYGVKKLGWLGVGGKTMFAVLVLSWVLVAIGFAFNLLSK